MVWVECGIEVLLNLMYRYFHQFFKSYFYFPLMVISATSVSYLRLERAAQAQKLGKALLLMSAVMFFVGLDFTPLDQSISNSLYHGFWGVVWVAMSLRVIHEQATEALINKAELQLDSLRLKHSLSKWISEFYHSQTLLLTSLFKYLRLVLLSAFVDPPLVFKPSATAPLSFRS